MSVDMNAFKGHLPSPTVSGLTERLRTLRATGDCCQNLDATAAAARAAPGLDDARARYEALADNNRLLACAMIKRSPGLCGCELQAGLGLTHATVSHHMRILQDAGLVAGQRRGRWVHYQLTDAARHLVP